MNFLPSLLFRRVFIRVFALCFWSSTSFYLVKGYGQEEEPVSLDAEQIDGRYGEIVHAKGQVEFEQGELRLQADRLDYFHLDGMLDAEGNVRVEQPDRTILAPQIRFYPDTKTGHVTQPQYQLRKLGLPGRLPATEIDSEDEFFLPNPRKQGKESRGGADKIMLEGQNRMKMHNATYTTCKSDDPDWYAKASTLRLDRDLHLGYGSHARIYFKEVPILYSPYFTFSLSEGRVSGFLTPSWGTSTRSGLEINTPFYWNLAPNYDMTSNFRLLEQRGLQLGNQFRYLGDNYSGQLDHAILDDKKYGETRQFYALQHRHDLGMGFSGNIKYSDVTDDQYFTDLSPSLTTASQVQLPGQYKLSYNPQTWWHADAQILRYQTLQPDPSVSVEEPYKLMPRLSVTGEKRDVLGFDFNLFSQYTRFDHSSKVKGQRFFFYPEMSWSLLGAGYFLTPKLGFHLSQYRLSQYSEDSDFKSSLNRAMPIFSLDSGLIFERNFQFADKQYLQTLEPRLFYVDIPYRDQDHFPVFDTGVRDFNFAQIFSENRYSGHDRIGDARQVTLALTSRFLDLSNNAERIRATVAQRYNLESPKVLLRESEQTGSQNSNILAAINGSILPRVYVDAALQYDEDEKEIRRTSFEISYQPDHGKSISIAYRKNYDQLEHVDLTAQWPLGKGWYGVGRYNYALSDGSLEGGQLIEALGGLEYKAGCWVARFVVHRVESVGGSSKDSFFAQLELNDFASIGFDPLELLSRSISGYTKINNIDGSYNEIDIQ